MSNIRLGIRAHDLKVDSLAALMNRAQKFGFRNFHFAPNKLAFLDLKDNRFNFGAANFLDQTLAINEMQIFILGCYVNIIDPDPKQKEENLRQFENYLTASRWFKFSPIVGTETGSVSPNGFTANNFTDKAFQSVVSSVKRLVGFAEQVGATMAVEPGINHPLYNFTLTKRLFQEIDNPNLKLIFDPVNLITTDNYKHQEQLISNFLSYFGNSIVSFHLKDFIIKNGNIVNVPFGKGILNRKFYLEQINQGFPNAFCSLEGLEENQILSAIQSVSKLTTIDLN